jgi:hypothetical protein
VIQGTTSSVGGAVFTPVSTGPLASPAQVKPGSGTGRISGGSIGMWSVIVGVVVAVMLWL